MTDHEQLVVPPLLVSPEVEAIIRQIIGKKFKLPPDEIDLELNLTPLHKEGFIRAAGSIPDIERKLDLKLDLETQEYAEFLNERTQGVITPDRLQKLRRLVPDIDSHSDNRQDYVMSIGLIGRLCASALERRQSDMNTWDEATRKLMLGHYVASAPIEDREWCASLPAQMGQGLYRLYLTGMLRAAFVRTGTLLPNTIEVLEVAEKYAETAKNASVLDKTFRRVGTWRMRLNDLYPALLLVLRPECTAADGGEIFFRVSRAFDWNQAQTIAAAREWQRSLISPLKDESQFAAEWRTPEVVEQAQRMHETREFGEFEKLGPLLMQAGCTSEEILNHCTEPQRRHLRGDWLIKLILDAPPKTPASRKVASTKSDKPAKQPKLTAKQKKEFKEVLAEDYGALSIGAAWTAIWQLNSAVEQVDYRHRHPELSEAVFAALGGIFRARRMFNVNVAVARRWHLNSSIELQQALVLRARLSLVMWLKQPPEADAVPLEYAFVSGDLATLEWFHRELGTYLCPNLNFETWRYLALQAILARDEAQMNRLANHIPEELDRFPQPNIDPILLATLRGDAGQVVSSLNAALEMDRAAEHPECFGAFCMPAHAGYRAAYWRDPSLVAGFNVSQGAPWDAEYHSTSMANPKPLEGFDYAAAPAPLRDLLLTEQIPDWLRSLQVWENPYDTRLMLSQKRLTRNPDAGSALA